MLDAPALRVVFMGTAPISCTCLDAVLAAGYEVVGVITQPDRPKGRHLQPEASPVKKLALAGKLDIFSPESVNGEEAAAWLAARAPDIGVVVAYGQILRKHVLSAPRMGCVNVHASLLPAWRGAAPVQWSIADGDRVTGVTTMFMNEKMDAGDILLQAETPIGVEDTAPDVFARLAELGAELLVQTLRELEAGTVEPKQQDASLVTLAPKLKKADGRIDWTRPAAEIANRVRGFTPWPGCYCELRAGKARRLRVLRARAVDVDTTEYTTAGTLIEADDAGFVVATGDTQSGAHALQLLEVQPEGKRAMSGRDFVHGHQLPVGELL